MICPNKICQKEIPDDSCFCDQCGTQLLKCDKCSFVSTSKFCAKCGGQMSTIEPPAFFSDAQPATPSAAPTPAQSPVVSAAPTGTPAAAPTATPATPTGTPAATTIVSLPADKIFLCHTEGWNIEIANNDILGRTNGQHTAHLGKFPVISSNHAKITQKNSEWFITDLNSTNKTYINSVKIEPNVPVKIKQNDVVILANVTFTVREA